jgi:hypothetical protein
MNKHMQLLMIAMFMLVGLAACGSSRDALPTAAADTAMRGISLRILPESRIDNPSAVELLVSEADGLLDVRVRLRDGSGLQALYYEISYDDELLNPQEYSATADIAERQLLGLAVNDDAGHIQFGHVLPNFDLHEPLQAAGTLARLQFSHEAQAALRSSSQVPRSIRAAAPTEVFAGPAFSGGEILLCTVQYTNPGDYDQNGLVTISDLTPLALHFGKSGPFAPDVAFIGFGSYPVESLVDGDGNGEINLADLTVIGQNFGNDALGGYNIYGSATLDALPASPDAESSIPPVTSVPFLDGDGDTTTQRLSYNYFQPSAPAGAVYMWSRPVDAEGNEGTPSEPALLAAAGGPTLSLGPGALSGSGTESDPLRVDPLNEHQLILTSPVDGDVTLSPEAQYFLIGGFDVIGGRGEIIELDRAAIISASRAASFAVPNVGAIDPDTAVLDIVDIYQGNFSIIGVYQGRISNTLYFYVPDFDNLAPVAVISFDSLTGTAPWTATLSTLGSSDFDGTLEQYDWDLDGDGTYEIIAGSPNQFLDLNSGGTQIVRLRVTDDDAATAVATQTFTSAGWRSIALDSVSDSLPADPMLSIIDGKPAVAYRRFNNLQYIRAADAAGTSWNLPKAVPSSVTAQHISLRELAGGRPAMAYQRSTADQGIYYVVGNAPDAVSFEQVRITSDPLDHSPSLNIIDGNPALAYVWHTGDADDPYSIYYARASDPVANTGGDWDLFNGNVVWKGSEFHLDKTALTIANANEVGTTGRPAVWYLLNNDQYDSPPRAYFSKSLNNQGTSWTLIPYSLGDNVPGDHELAFAAATSIVSRPHLVLRNMLSGALMVRKANDLATTDWTAPEYIPDADSSDFGHHLSCANVAGFMGLAYYDNENKTVVYRGTETVNIDDDFPLGGVVARDVGDYDLATKDAKYISVSAALGKPVLVYHDLANAELRYAYYFELP